MTQENIKTSKVTYGAQSANEFIDKSFSELFKTKDPINLNRFFSMYDNLFYNIPQTGDQSHTTLINKSQDYVNGYQNPLQVEVDTLREEIIRLTEQLNETENENPFYSNGTILAPMDTDGTPHGYNIHYMDRGLARKVIGGYDGDVFLALKASLGFPVSTSYDDIVLAVPKTIIDGLDKGSYLDIEDIAYPGAKNAERRLEKNITQQNQVSIDNITNNSWWGQYLNSGVGEFNRINLINEGVPIIKDAIKNAWRQETQIEILRNEYSRDIKYGYTEEERTNGQILLDQLLGNNQKQVSYINNLTQKIIQPYNKLDAIRDTVVRYRRMWMLLKDANINTYSIITDIKTAVNNPVSKTERSEFEGKWSDNNFIEFFPGINLEDGELSPYNVNLPGPPNMGQGQ